MTWRCEICWFSGEEDVFYKEDVDDMIEMLEEVYQSICKLLKFQPETHSVVFGV